MFMRTQEHLGTNCHSSPQRQVRRGNVLIFFCVCLITVLSIVALSLDGGALMQERQHAQAVADAAALSAAADMFDHYLNESGQDPNGTARQSAKTTAKANGYGDDGTLSKVTVHLPPISGPFAKRRGYVEVIVEYNQTRSFSNLFNSGPIPVRARAVAVGTTVAADVGILVLDPTSRSAFNSQGGGTSVVDGTPVVVNSTNAEGGVGGGGGSLTADEFIFAGGYTTNGGAQFIGPTYTNQPPMLDPLAWLPVPDPSTMTVQSTKKIQASSGFYDLKPGVYQGGINVTGTGSINLAPGIYYMDGGGFSFSGQGSLVGHGVMIYNAPGNGNSDGISVTGQGVVQLSGMTDGIYKGITFFQDRNSSVTGNIAGNSGLTEITGTFYFAGALLNITGNGGVVNLGSQYISWQLNLGGNGGIHIGWRPEYVAQKRAIHLVE
ncbi:MAG: pilus assembly protein TadG-related protein [Gemmataceae bacterium]|nr:pilus assembly protein TadG-related protein [Gemmataceae bacterium]MCI0741617.1 pilus assembly protein TadG-related protein [Gemmataceae bacterium]